MNLALKYAQMDPFDAVEDIGVSFCLQWLPEGEVPYSRWRATPYVEGEEVTSEAMGPVTATSIVTQKYLLRYPNGRKGGEETEQGE